MMTVPFTKFTFCDNGVVYLHKSKMKELASFSGYFESVLNRDHIHFGNVYSYDFQSAIDITNNALLLLNDNVDFEVTLLLNRLGLMTPRLLNMQWQKVQNVINRKP